MRYSLLSAALAAPVVFAAPVKRQSANIDAVVLQFALTLEHLENAFYRGALQKFSAADFAAAGYGANFYNNLKFIASDEQSHVQFLQTGLTAAGQTPTSECVYNFPYTDVASFITLSSVLEGVGTSAYLGAAPLITSKDYLTAAGSILVTEALHTSYQRNAVNEVPFANPYGTPLDPTSVFTLASAFIKSCPASNPSLPFTAYPALSLKTTAGTCEEPNCGVKVIKKRDDGDEWVSYDDGSNSGHYESDYNGGYDGGHSGHYESDYNGGYDGGNSGHYEGDYNGGYDGGNSGHYEGDYNGGYNGGYDAGHSGHYEGDYNGGNNNGWSGYDGSYGKTLDAALRAGQKATFTGVSAIPSGAYLTFVSGLMVVSTQASISGNDVSATIPDAAMGQTYVFVTRTAANGKLDASQVLFGPAILEVAPGSPGY